MNYILLNGYIFLFTIYMAIDFNDGYVYQRNGLKIDHKVKESALEYEPSKYINANKI